MSEVPGPTLQLSGRALTRDKVEEFEIGEYDFDKGEFLPIEEGDGLLPGDLKLIPSLDANGRAALQGGHSNFGYSGYFKASIFDGTKWRRFELRSIVPQAQTAYARQQDQPDTIAAIRRHVEAARGRACIFSVPEGSKQGRFAAV